MDNLLLEKLAFYTLDDIYVFLNKDFGKNGLSGAGDFVTDIANYDSDFFNCILGYSFFYYAKHRVSDTEVIYNDSIFDFFVNEIQKELAHLTESLSDFKNNKNKITLSTLQKNVLFKTFKLIDVMDFLYNDFYKIYCKWELPVPAKVIILECINALTKFSSPEISMMELTELCKTTIEKYKNIARKIIDNDYMIVADLHQKIMVDVTYIKDENKVVNVYTLSDIESLLAYDAVFLQSNNVQIKKCMNCHRYFIPSGRSDQIYCDYIYEKGKTCKQIGYEIKLKHDAFRSAYRKAYKTQKARVKYNLHVPDYENRHFVPWNAAAKKAMAEYQQKGDIDGFIKWLSENKDTYK